MLARRRPRGYTLIEIIVSLTIIIAVTVVSYSTFPALYAADDAYRARQIAAEYETAARAIAADGNDSAVAAAASPTANASSPTGPLNMAKSAISVDPAPVFSRISSNISDTNNVDDDGYVQMDWNGQTVCIDFAPGDASTNPSVSPLVPAAVLDGACP